MIAASRAEQASLTIYNPESDLERRFHHWANVTNGIAVAAAILAAAEVQSRQQPAAEREAALDILNPNDVAKELHVSPATVIGWIRSGQLKAANLATGHRPRYVVKRDDLNAFLRLRQAAQRRKPR